jgi:shikimate kinase/3-dehydroquinate synthase
MKNIVLIGFMGTGKTTVGQLLAKRLGWKFVDTDALIEAEEGKGIPEIFSDSGEAYFRQKESAVIRRVSLGENQVIATGGGAVMDRANWEALHATGWLVALLASKESIAQRTAVANHRPLLQTGDRLASIDRLLTARLPRYKQADILIDTDGLSSASEVAEEVRRRLEERQKSMARRVLKLPLGERSYEISIAPKNLENVGERLHGLGIHSPLLIVTNPKVGGLYLNKLEESLIRSGWAYEVAVVPDGESYKSLEQASRLYDAAIRAGLDRKSAILALGGGVIGDLAGFVAATYMRGINFVQLPTTLLAQVDSSVGGKVAVNHPSGKNLIGCFYQPRIVLSDLDTLQSLEPRDFASGLAEVVKSAMIGDAELFRYLECHQTAVNQKEPDVLAEIVARVCRIKADVVAADEKEGGMRAILNFGHTVGHAVETVTNYQTYRHGEAVAMGMVAAMELSLAMGYGSQADAERLKTLLAAFHLPTELPHLPLNRLMVAMGKDKKAEQGVVGFVLIKQIGEAQWGCVLPEETILDVLLRMGAVKE